jgi:hypothetical protein
MTRLISGISGLALAASVAGVAGCGSDKEERAQASPMYTANLTQTCAFNEGPLAGQTIDYSGAAGASAVPVGNPCADMQGSRGWAVAPQAGREQGHRFYTSPGAPSAWGSSGALNPGYSRSCRFNSGPAAGQTSDFSNALAAQPAAIGSACSDGPNSGVVVGPATQ